MYKMVAQIEADGDKKTIYALKEEIFRIGAQHSCRLEITLSSSEGFQEMTSASFSPIVDVSADDIVDLTLTGDEQYELLVSSESVKEGGQS